MRLGSYVLLALAAALILAAAAVAAGHRTSDPSVSQPAWVAKTSALLVREWFPHQPKPSSIAVHLGARRSTLVLLFTRRVTCNCPAPPGAAVSGRRAVFTLDTHTQRMLSFQVFDR